QPFFCAEALVGVRTVNAHAEDCRVPASELSLIALEVVRFKGAAWGHVLGIEVERDPFAAIILQSHGSAILREQREVGRSGAGDWKSARRKKEKRNQQSRSNHYYDEQDCPHAHRILLRLVYPP